MFLRLITRFSRNQIAKVVFGVTGKVMRSVRKRSLKTMAVIEDGNSQDFEAFEHCKNGKVELSRPIYAYKKRSSSRDKKSLLDYFAITAKYFKAAYCPEKSLRRLMSRSCPPIDWLSTYSWKTWLISDMIAGLTVGVMAVPEGLAYSKLAGMPAVYGIYTNAIPSLVYVLLGTTRHAIIGPLTTLSLVISAVRYKYIPCEDCWQNTNTNISNFYLADKPTVELTPIELGSTVAFLSGTYLIMMGAFRISAISIFLSDQVVGGFTFGIALQLAASQLDSIFGIGLPKRNGLGKVVLNFIDLIFQIHKTNLATLSTFLPCFLFLLILKTAVNPKVQAKLKFPIPGELIVVACGTLVSYYGDLSTRYGVKTIEKIPAGLPRPVLPRFDAISVLWADSIVPAIVTFSLSLSFAKIFSRRNGYRIDATQEFYAYGAMNVVGSFFQCIGAGQSMTRSMVCERTGGKTQLSAFFAVVVGMVFITFIAPFMELLPSCILSSIVSTACILMLSNVGEVKKLYRYSKIDLSTYIATAAGVICLDLAYGLATGVLWSLTTFVLRSIMVKIKSIDIEANALCQSDVPSRASDHTVSKLHSEIKVIRLDSPLFFANAHKFKSEAMGIFVDSCRADKPKCGVFHIKDECTDCLSPISPKIKILIMDVARVPFVDYMGINALKEIKGDLKRRGVDLLISGCSDSHWRLFERADFLDDDSETVFPTLIDAISYAKMIIRSHKL